MIALVLKANVHTGKMEKTFVEFIIKREARNIAGYFDAQNPQRLQQRSEGYLVVRSDERGATIIACVEDFLFVVTMFDKVSGRFPNTFMIKNTKCSRMVAVLSEISSFFNHIT
jgi:hypothetical protein